MTKRNLLILGLLGLLASSAAIATSTEAVSTTPVLVVLRQNEGTITLQPGEQGGVISPCSTGEAVVGGGPTGVPGSVAIVYSTLFFDGQHSGWQVQWINNGTQTVVVTPRVGALCVKGAVIAR